MDRPLSFRSLDDASLGRVREAVHTHADRAVAFLEPLGAAPSVPALCYGPVARNIHGVNESVNLASIVEGATTLAHFIAGLGPTKDAS
jgi:acetylornithine deacetylase